MIHPDMTMMLARQRVAERTANATNRPRVAPRRPGLRVRCGDLLVRWGTRLARRPTPAAIVRSINVAQ